MRGRWLKVLMVVLVLVPVGLTAYLANNLYHRKGVPEALENLTRQLFRSKEDERKAEARAVELERKAGELQTAYDALVADLRGEVDSRDIRVRQFREKLEINFVDKVLFASGSAEITPRGRAILLKVAGVLNRVKDKSIYVVGHTDANPIHSALYPSNWELSTARSSSVIRFLSEQGGLTPERFTAMGRAFYQPVASNATPEGRQENRRVDVIIADVPLLSSETGSESVRGTATGKEPAAQSPAPGQEPLRESAPPPPPPGPNEPLAPTPSPSSQEEATTTPPQAEPAPPGDVAEPAAPAADVTTPAGPDAAGAKPASPPVPPDLPPALPDKPAPGK
ncbi:OmpA family protein [Solidesulfovibrio alcoholivorans]|uniref:OmpA family protein n=1 Tax=Solidesulfovibrio alcoholivorans TaxID=81406 RepID=UPI00049730ED|nr:OmpA family protein [Solidesulfovibrio alcoholivorans]